MELPPTASQAYRKAAGGGPRGGKPDEHGHDMADEEDGRPLKRQAMSMSLGSLLVGGGAREGVGG